MSKSIIHLKRCWNPACDKMLHIKSTKCSSCGWVKEGPLAGPPRAIRAKARPFDPAADLNGEERAYHAHLERELLLGRIQGFAIEPFSVRIGYRCFYLPDFVVITNEGYIELHDVKAKWSKAKSPHVEDDAQVKMKAVAANLPWLSVVVVYREKKGEWQRIDYRRK